MAFDILTYMMAKGAGGVTPEELAEALATKQNKLTAGTNVTIQNNVISSNQPTAVNPFTLSFGNDDYNGSAPKLITAEKIGAATEDFVNSSIATNTAYFKGTFNSLAELEAISETEEVSNNDYGFVKGTDAAGNTTYTRYKYNADDEEWIEEYVLNNSSFTAEQWATIQSGITSADKTQIATNTSAIAELSADMPDSPEDVNAQPKSLIIEADFDGENITITDSRYIEEGTVKYSQLFSDSMTAFNGGTDVVIRISFGEVFVVDLKCNCFNGSELVFEGHNNAAVIIVTMNDSSVVLVTIYNIEPAESLVSADDGDLTTAKAQKDYFQKIIDSNNMLPYSYISGTPTLATVATSGSYNDLSNRPIIPTVPSNLVLGYSGTTSTASALKIVTCTQAQYDASSKSDDTVYLIKS